jgi:glycosyltransferase involved in cell wall biosynthesis
VNILFLTLAYPITGQNLYTDIVDELINQGNTVTVCTQDETRVFGSISFSYRGKVCILSIPTGAITQTTTIRKGINTLLLEYRFLKKISQFNFISLDLLIYSTPPITFQKVVTRLKSKYNCINYLLLRDIFPQNAVDLKMIKKNSLVYSYFRHKEKNLYKNSDIIGCLSPANVRCLLDNNPELGNKKVRIAPNCIFPLKEIINSNKEETLSKYNIPFKRIHFIYGGNLGKPQGIDFIIKCVDELKYDNAIFITIVGNGTEYNKLSKFLMDNKISNVALIDFLPKNRYLELLACMDIGLIFLDSRFTIPNFPSRMLDYMNFSLPIVACTDSICDIKQEICDQGAGFWCRSDDIEAFKQIIEIIKRNKDICIEMGEKSRKLLINKYSTVHVVEDILHEINNLKNLTKHNDL